MDKVKENKLNAIKSDILEIREFVTSISNNNNLEPSFDDDINSKVNDTHTLTKIVGVENNNQKLNVFENINEEINTIKTILNEHEKILKEILLKIN